MGPAPSPCSPRGPSNPRIRSILQAGANYVVITNRSFLCFRCRCRSYRYGSYCRRRSCLRGINVYVIFYEICSLLNRFVPAVCRPICVCGVPVRAFGVCINSASDCSFIGTRAISGISCPDILNSTITA